MASIDADVAVVGAGPVGLSAALACARRGLNVVVLEKNQQRPKQSRAIGITPPTLAFMSRLGCVDSFIQSGVAVRTAGGYARTGVLARVAFDNLPTPWPFVLAIPQYLTESILESSVRANRFIEFRRGCEVLSARISGTSAILSIRGKEESIVRARIVLGCDGSTSLLRAQSGIAWRGAPYTQTFLMADYVDRTGWPRGEARLYFTARGSVESFPLPGGLRRFVLRTPTFTKENTSDFLEREIPLRANVFVDARDKQWESAFGVQRFLARPFAVPGLFLCGDAAHVMSPIGGQNMNAGFADAECAAWCAHKALQNPEKAADIAALYTSFRRRAALHAGLRAALMMRLGTGGGFAWNLIRAGFVWAGLTSPFKQVMYGMFTMLSLPNNDFSHYQKVMQQALEQ